MRAGRGLLKGSTETSTKMPFSLEKTISCDRLSCDRTLRIVSQLARSGAELLHVTVPGGYCGNASVHSKLKDILYEGRQHAPCRRDSSNPSGTQSSQACQLLPSHTRSTGSHTNINTTSQLVLEAVGSNI